MFKTTPAVARKAGCENPSPLSDYERRLEWQANVTGGPLHDPLLWIRAGIGFPKPAEPVHGNGN